MAGNDGAYDALEVDLCEVVRALLQSPWRQDDLFQVPLLLATVLEVMDKDSSIRLSSFEKDETEQAIVADHVTSLVDAVLEARPLRRLGVTQSYSDYILFQCTEAYAALNRGGLERLSSLAMPEDSANKLSLALLRCSEVSLNELCRQLAFRTASDQSNFDIMRLAYSLLTYVTATKALTDTCYAGIELEKGEGPAAGTRASPINMNIVRESLRVFFEEQLDNGMWEKGKSFLPKHLAAWSLTTVSQDNPFTRNFVNRVAMSAMLSSLQPILWRPCWNGSTLRNSGPIYHNSKKR
jgi:hypothetical protein